MAVSSQHCLPCPPSHGPRATSMESSGVPTHQTWLMLKAFLRRGGEAEDLRGDLPRAGRPKGLKECDGVPVMRCPSQGPVDVVEALGGTGAGSPMSWGAGNGFIIDR